MKKFIKHYKNPNEDRVNVNIMKKTYDKSLMTYIADTCKSLEVLKYIKFLGYEYIDDEHLIDYNNYINAQLLQTNYEM